MLESIPSLYEKFLKSTGVCTDTRSLKVGQIFFALKGPNFNGNSYATKALEDGAEYVVIDEERYNNGERYLLAKDVLQTLQELAAYHRNQFDIPFLGITGSNGKTTTKELAARVLGTKFKVHFTQGNLNNHIGVPLTLLSMGEETDFAIIEMGANHLGDIAELCEIARPTHGLITNIGNAHLGEFGGMENLIRAKSELFDYMRKNQGTVFINSEDDVLKNMSKRFSDAVIYPNTDCSLVAADPFINYLDDTLQEHSTELIGAYNFMNIAAAVAIGKFFGVEDPYDAIDRFVPNNNRSELMDIGSNKIVLDAYNANPSSMEAALKNLMQMKGTTKIAMLGDMKEMGTYAEAEHKKIIQLTRALGITMTFWVGDDFVRVSDHENAFKNIQELINHLEEHPLSGSTVLIKGSRSMQMEKLTQSKKIWI